MHARFRKKWNDSRSKYVVFRWRCAGLLLFLINYGVFPGDIPDSLLSGYDSAFMKEKVDHYQKLGYKILPPRFPDGGTVPRGRYAAIDRFIVNRGKTVVIEGGTSILFEAGNDVTVEGTLIADGSAERHIVFSNIPYNEGYVPVGPSDTLWGGITVADGGKADLRHSIIKNAQQGLAIENAEDTVSLECVDLFRIQSEQLRITGENKVYGDTLCLDFITYTPQPSLSTTPGPSPESPSPRLHIGTVSGIVAAVSAVGVLGSFVVNRVYYNKVNHSESCDDALRYGKISNNALTSVAICSFLCAGSAAVWGITFTMDLK